MGRTRSFGDVCPMSGLPPESGLKSEVVTYPRMGWTGRAPAPNGSQSAPGACQERSTTMPRATTLHAVTAIGIDMGKNTLHLIGLDARGAIMLREKVARGRIALRLANLPPCHPASLASKREWRRTMLLASLPRLAMM
jgi:hypothetical protein